METVKNYLGYGQTTQSGEEPVSGKTGEGTSAEPYDAGNSVDDPALGSAAAQNTPSNTTGAAGAESVPGSTNTGAISQSGAHHLSSAADERSTGQSGSLSGVTGAGSKNQSGTEPVSGLRGSGTAGEPYDAGNVGDSELGGRAPQDTSSGLAGERQGGKGDPLTSAISSELGETSDKKTGTGSPWSEDTNTQLNAVSGSGPRATQPSVLATSNDSKAPHDSTLGSTHDSTLGSTHDSTLGSTSTGSRTAQPSTLGSSEASAVSPTRENPTAGSNKALPSAPEDDLEEDDGAGGKKSLSTKIKEKLHIGKTHDTIPHSKAV